MLRLNFQVNNEKKPLEKDDLRNYLTQFKQTFFQPEDLDFTMPNYDFDTVIILGIGGSAMGSRYFYHFLRANTSKKLIVLDNIHPDWVEQKLSGLDLKKCHFVTVTKSGTTLETNLLNQLIINLLNAQNLDDSIYISLVTDNLDSQLAKDYESKNRIIHLFPKSVGGRFSVFTHASMWPMFLLGLDVKRILEVAKDSFKNLLDEKFETVQYLGEYLLLNHNQHKTNLIVFNYEPALSWFGPWLSQLVCESLGKDSLGFQVVSARGTTDQHSMTQHWKMGKDNSVVMFIEPLNFKKDFDLTYNDKPLSLKNVLLQFLNANQKVFDNIGRSNFTISVNNEIKDLTEMTCLFMLTVCYLGASLKINAFDQPAVDWSKEILKKNLNL